VAATTFTADDRQQRTPPVGGAAQTATTVIHPTLPKTAARRGLRSRGDPAGRSSESGGDEEVVELTRPRSWAVRGVGRPVVATATGTIEPLDHGERSRLTIAREI
jgi:hypothetical protein